MKLNLIMSIDNLADYLAYSTCLVNCSSVSKLNKKGVREVENPPNEK